MRRCVIGQRSFGICPGSTRPVVSRPASTLFNKTATTDYYRRGSLSSLFSGLSLSPATPLPTQKRSEGFIVEANAKNSQGARSGMGTKRKARRVSGFRARMRTPGGRRVLKRRRNKGRHVLCPASVRPYFERFTNKY